jgi:hypothetical protein
MEKMMLLSYCRLTPDHVEQLVDLEQATFPPMFHVGAATFHYFLSLAEIKGKNYSVAILDNDLLVGYGLMINHPSDFFPGKEVAYVISMAVRLRYRREAVVPMLDYMFREAYRTGSCIEGKMREATAFRMIQRNWQLVRGYGYRITHLHELDRVGTDRMLGVRFDQMYSRSPLLWGGYQSVTQVERTRRILQAAPRRALRKICQRMPETALSPQLRRLAYLNQPPVPEQQDSAAQH